MFAFSFHQRHLITILENVYWIYSHKPFYTNYIKQKKVEILCTMKNKGVRSETPSMQNILNQIKTD